MYPVYSKQKAIQALITEILKEDIPDLSGVLSRILTRIQDAEMRHSILDGFIESSASINFDQLWTTWNDTRHPELETFLLESGTQAISPEKMRILSMLKLGKMQGLVNSRPETISFLLMAGRDQDAQVAERAIWVLSHLDDDSAKEEVCRWVIEHDDPIARQIALSVNYMPRNPQKRALFFMLTEQWKKYESLDFDASLFNAVYQAANPDFRKKVSKFALQVGWGGYVDAITRSRQAKSLSMLDDTEWKTIITILSREQRGEELWRLAQVAPVKYSISILQELCDLEWQSEKPTERREYNNWVQAAQKCWNIEKPVSRIPIRKLTWAAHSRLITSLCMQPQGDFLASGSADQNVCIWQTQDGSLTHRIEKLAGYIQCLSASMDGKFLASGSSDRSVSIWNFKNSDRLHTFGGHAGEISSLAFSSDSRLLASGDANQVRIWEVQSGKLSKQIPIPEGPVNQLAFDTKGTFLLAGGQKSLYIIHLTENSPPQSIPESVRSWQLVPSTQSTLSERLVITSSSYKKIRLWEMPSGKQIALLDRLADGQNLCANLQGGLIIATDRNKLLRWELPAGKPLLPDLEAHSDQITMIKCDSHGEILVSVGEEGSVFLWQNSTNRKQLLADELGSSIKQLVMDQAGLKIAYQQQNKITLYDLFDLGDLIKKPVDSIKIEDIVQAETHIKSLPDHEIETSWINLVRMGVEFRNRFDIELSENIPTIEVGNFDIQLD